jgi:hypothetical protein
MVRNYPAHFFMSSFFKNPISLWFFLIFAGTSYVSAAPQGFLEGHLKIMSGREVELAGQTPPAKFEAANYADYPLVILSQDGKTEIARVAADGNGNYRLALPPGDYILDVQGRPPKGHLRAKPQPFTVTSNQIARVDMDIDTGIR